MIQLNKTLKAIIGIIFLIVPLLLYGLWIYAFNQTNGYPENVNLYDSYFPPFLRGRFTTTILSFLLCLFAVMLNLGNLKNSNRIFSIVSWLVVIVGGLLGFLNLFSML
jgi:hypothetical protein